jgi:hypothetical protein
LSEFGTHLTALGVEVVENGGVAVMVKKQNFEVLMSWTGFRRQFEVVANHDYWQAREITLLLSIQERQPVDIPHSVPTAAICACIVRRLECCYEACRSQLIARSQLSGDSLQEFAAPFWQFAHMTLFDFP